MISFSTKLKNTTSKNWRPLIFIAVAVILILLKISPEYIVFACTLLGVAVYHKFRTFFSLGGLATIVAYKLSYTGFSGHSGISGLSHHFHHEWSLVANLFLLLTGFDVVAHHFKKSHLTARLPRYLADDWRGGFQLLIVIFVMSIFLDNIAAAMIGATIAASVFRGKVSIGYIAASVAAANAGGAGSVIGDTTTTMAWIKGYSPIQVLPAFVGATASLFFFGVIAAIQQQQHQPIVKDEEEHHQIDWTRLIIVAIILASAVVTNFYINVYQREHADSLPWIGMAVWFGILITAPLRHPHWQGVIHASRGAIFLIGLVLSAGMVPLSGLPKPSWETELGIAFFSAVFDNIPLMALALKQGGYVIERLTYSTGCGGSMTSFGSSAGVAATGHFPYASDPIKWVREGWYVIAATVVGFGALMLWAWLWWLALIAIVIEYFVLTRLVAPWLVSKSNTTIR